MNDERKAQALAEIRRRVETATDPRTRIYWKLIARMVEPGSTFQQCGHEVDEAGEGWSYCISLKGMLTEPFRDALPLMQIDRIRGRMETIIGFHEARNQALKIDGQQKDILTNRICEAVLLQK